MKVLKTIGTGILAAQVTWWAVTSVAWAGTAIDRLVNDPEQLEKCASMTGAIGVAFDMAKDDIMKYIHHGMNIKNM